MSMMSRFVYGVMIGISLFCSTHTQSFDDLLQQASDEQKIQPGAVITKVVPKAVNVQQQLMQNFVSWHTNVSYRSAMDILSNASLSRVYSNGMFMIQLFFMQYNVMVQQKLTSEKDKKNHISLATLLHAVTGATVPKGAQSHVDFSTLLKVVPVIPSAQHIHSQAFATMVQKIQNTAVSSVVQKQGPGLQKLLTVVQAEPVKKAYVAQSFDKLIRIA